MVLLFCIGCGIFSYIHFKYIRWNSFASRITIGQNKESIEERIGKAYYQQTNTNNISEYIYIINDVVLRIYYKDNQLISYFVTLRNNVEIGFPEQYSYLVNDKGLGNFTFYEIEGAPSCVESYVSNGVGHSFYAEKYYFGAGGNYYDFYFLQLDYGIDNTEYISDKNIFYDEEIDKIKLENFDYVLMRDRKKSYPNTFGISLPEYSDEVYEMISYYGNFDFNILY